MYKEILQTPKSTTVHTPVGVDTRYGLVINASIIIQVLYVVRVNLLNDCPITLYNTSEYNLELMELHQKQCGS